jgi:hypothetical protein
MLPACSIVLHNNLTSIYRGLPSFCPSASTSGKASILEEESEVLGAGCPKSDCGLALLCRSASQRTATAPSNVQGYTDLFMYCLFFNSESFFVAGESILSDGDMYVCLFILTDSFGQ